MSKTKKKNIIENLIKKDTKCVAFNEYRSNNDNTCINKINDDLKDENILKWKEKSMIKMKSKLKETIKERTKKINDIINHEIPIILKEFHIFIDYNKIKKFGISDDIVNNTRNNIINEFSIWNSKGGVKIKSCRKRALNNFNDYYRVADNWFNRHKGEWFGKYYFKCIFKLLNQYNIYLVNNIFNSNNNSNNDVNVVILLANYVSIKCLLKLGDTNITFKQARPQCLIYINSLTKKQEFREELIHFGNDYDVPFDISKHGNQQIIRKEFRDWAINVGNTIKKMYHKKTRPKKIKQKLPPNPGVPILPLNLSLLKPPIQTQGLLPPNYVYNNSNNNINSITRSIDDPILEDFDITYIPSKLPKLKPITNDNDLFPSKLPELKPITNDDDLFLRGNSLRNIPFKNQFDSNTFRNNNYNKLNNNNSNNNIIWNSNSVNRGFNSNNSIISSNSINSSSNSINSSIHSIISSNSINSINSSMSPTSIRNTNTFTNSNNSMYLDYNFNDNISIGTGTFSDSIPPFPWPINNNYIDNSGVNDNYFSANVGNNFNINNSNNTIINNTNNTNNNSNNYTLPTNPSNVYI